MTDEQYMKRALELAGRGTGYTSPNPMVGAVIVKDNKMIGEGWHERYGDLHAERNALKNCKGSPQGADMYVTLEPCCHYGKQPPCVEAIIESGIKRVFVGSKDPNPLVAGKGVRILKEHGIEVVEDVLREECDRLNEVFFYYIQTKRPYVVMKYAMTMDGKIATYSGLSKWITGEKAREHVQNLRHRYKAIMAGIGTALADNPLLTCRIEDGVNPVRIICDSRLRIPLDSQIVKTAAEVPTIIAVSEEYVKTDCQISQKISELENDGIEILHIGEKDGHIDLNELMAKLGEKSIDSILLEGGGTLNWSALESGIVNKVMTYVAGHVDGTGKVISIMKDDNAIWYTVQAAPGIMRYIVEKGSVTIDGISLTVAKVGADNFSISAIPHTVARTVLKDRKVGDAVNLETDIIGKYVEKLLFNGQTEEQAEPENGITRDFLAKYGF